MVQFHQTGGENRGQITLVGVCNLENVAVFKNATSSCFVVILCQETTCVLETNLLRHRKGDEVRG